MSYEMYISSQRKALFIFLLNQSASMEEPLTGGKRKIDQLTLAINAWLQTMLITCGKAVGYNDCFDICILGCGTDENSNPIIGSAFAGPLAGREMVSINDIAENLARIDKVTQLMPDDATGEMLTEETEIPVWIDATTHGATPICSAIVKACEIIDAWIPQHYSSFPPIVINITDGDSSEGDPIPYADTLKQRCTEDGNVLFFNCYLSATPADPFLFRGNSELMPDDFARRLFQMSSLLPEIMVYRGRAMGHDIEPNARGMVFNADMVSLIKFLDIGTRGAEKLR